MLPSCELYMGAASLSKGKTHTASFLGDVEGLRMNFDSQSFQSARKLPLFRSAKFQIMHP